MKSGRLRDAAVVSLLLGMLLISGVATAQIYGSNVIASHANTVTASSSGTASVNNTSTTGVSATVSGLAPGSSAVVTTSSLSGPSTGVGAFSISGTTSYYDISVTLPAGTTPPPGATVRVCFTSSSLTSSSTLNYYSGGQWVSATDVTVSGTKICGTVPLSALTGTNFVVGTPSAPNYTFYYIAGFVVVIIVIAIAVIMMRRRKKGP